ncbi:MAG: glycosyltransferase family 2 protein [Candidatus Coatesbacteria bacterium]|nr:glycosyltransferase family 2 protein [Candidatus Coatesbacteria bacterium]
MISIVVITHKRIFSLKALLDALNAETEEFEIVLINNSSSKEEEELLKYYDNIRYLSMGANIDLSQARNLGMNASEGDIIAFTDDDCIPKNGWLNVIKENIGDYDAIGGPVLSYLALKYPWWWDDEYSWLIGLSPPAMNYEEEGIVHIPQTANIALKRKVAQKVQFREALGKPRLPLREDTLFWKDIRSKGFKVRIIPEMIVYHRIPQERLYFHACIKRSFNDGLLQGYFREEDLKKIIKFGLISFIEIFVEMLRIRPKFVAAHILQTMRSMGFLYGILLYKSRNV